MTTDAIVLVRRAQAGERDALAQLVDAHQAQVYSLALSVMRNSADAADMTQDTFVRMLRCLSSFRGDQATFSTWLHRLTINVCLDGLRRRRRHPSEELSADEPAEQTCYDEPEPWLLQRESAAHVRAALAQLPLPQRVALTLLYFEDSSYDQIASVMRLPLNTIKSHVSRGKERMARLLSQRSRGPLFDPVLIPSPRRNPRLGLVAA